MEIKSRTVITAVLLSLCIHLVIFSASYWVVNLLNDQEQKDEIIVPVLNTRIINDKTTEIEPAEQPENEHEETRPEPKTEMSNTGNKTSTVISEPEIIDNTPPEYPKIARIRGYEGLVILSVTVTKEGNPKNISIKKSSGYNILDKAATDAVTNWRFKSIAEERKTEIKIRFQLN